MLSKYFVGVVNRDVVTDVTHLPSQITSSLLQVGQQDASLVLEGLSTSSAGLSAAEAAARLEEYGLNEIAHEKPAPWWLQLIQSFENSFTAVLFIIGIASLFTDVIFVAPQNRSWSSVVIISTMILLSSLLRFWQEFRSQQAAQKLYDMVQNKALILRSSWDDQSDDDSHKQKREILVADIVPGDIVYLSAGDMIPADIRLISSKDLFVSQSALTGESMPVEKYARPSEVSETLIETSKVANPLELGTLCLMGTNVISGTASGVVIATGNQTYFGSMAKSISGKRAMTSFDKGVNKVSWLLIRFMVVMVPIVFILNGFTKHSWEEAFFFALAVAVGLTPEMLPMIVTANLARGAIKMSKKKVIVKKLNAIQNFGAMDILCTDKTGTLTENRVVLMRYLNAEGVESERVLNLAYCNSYFQTGLKSLMDDAIIEKKEAKFKDNALANTTIEERTYKKIDEVPFDFARRRMSVILEKNDAHFLVCKGAVVETLRQCTQVEESGTIVPMTDELRERIKSFTMNLNKDGLRSIVIAYKPIVENKSFYSVADEESLIFAGYMGFLDPPKASAKGAIEQLAHHGVSVKVVTGDNEVVTARICQDVALDGSKVLLGHEIDGLNDEALATAAIDTVVFARVDPLQKARIVHALKAAGHTVGFLGDGVNDAAALRESDVGISVNTGVDIAKEAADIILLENDLYVLDQGVMGGRLVFGNIMKYIKMTASSNFGNVLSVLIASAILPFLPMQALQILIQNLLYDLSQLSIPWDNMDESFLQKPRKWEAQGIAKFMFFLGPTSSIFDMTTFALMWFVFGANSVGMQALFQSGWFVEGLLTQTLIVHIIRTQKIPFIQSRAALPVILLTAFIMAIGLFLPFSSLGAYIGLVTLPWAYFPWLVLTLLCYCVLTQGVKVWYMRMFKQWL